MADRARTRGFAGRDRELAELQRDLARARAGEPVLTVVEGPAGIGKSALVDQFVAANDDVSVHECSGVSWESGRPFEVVRRLLSQGGSRPPDELRDPVETGELLLETWRSGRGDEHATDVVVVDDAHWADIGSLRALSSAHRRATTDRLLVVLVARGERADSSSGDVHEFLAGHRGPLLRVGPLSPEDIQALAIQGAHVDLTAPAARTLAEHTLGNPLYARQLLREVPARTWHEWQPTLPAPEALTATVVRALRDCAPAARALVECAATLGSAPSLAEATALAGIDDPVDALDEATRAGLLTAGTGEGVSSPAFPHPLVRAAVYSHLSPSRRCQLHNDAAGIVDDEGAALRHRVAAAPLPDAALADEVDGFASRQAALGAWETVGNALLSAARLSPAKAQREHRLVRAVDAVVGAGDLPRAIALAPMIESHPPGALRDAVLGYLAILLGRAGEAETLLTSAWRRCDPAQDPETAALISQRRVLHAMSRWRGPELVAWAERAVELAAGPDTPSAVESRAIMGLGLAATGRTREAREAYHEVTTATRAGAQLQRVQLGKGWLDLALDDPHTARRELAGAAPTRYRRGSVRISLWAQAWMARAEFALGAWDDALHTVDRVVTDVEHTGLDLVRPLAHWTGAQTHALRGNWDAAHEHLQRASVAAHTYEVMLIPSCLAQAQCAEAQADYDTVLRCLEPLVRLQPRQGIDEPGFWPWHDVYANALVMARRAEDADEFLRPHEKVAAERGHRSTRARLGYVRGRIAGAAGDIDAAREAFEQALSQLTGVPLPYERARVQFAYGQTLRRAGKRREADGVLRQARDAYTALGARVYVERCDRELKAGGLKVRRSGAEWGELTAQEKAVAELVAAGMSNKDAAVELFVSVKTVQFHLTRIYAKLGIGSRGELAARFRGDTA